MTDTPNISIIIPVYNRSAELDQCLRSLDNSELMDVTEIIVIDDCSTEERVSIERVARNHGVRFHRQDTNGGPGVARNRGADMAEGKILVFIDSDCVAPSGWLSRLIQPINQGTCSATTACYSGPVTPNWITTFQDEDYRYRMPSSESNTSFVNSCNFAIDRGVFFDCGKFPDQRISEDMVFGLVLANRGTPACYLPDAGVLHEYCGDVSSYLKQRYTFAFNTVRSYIERDNIRSQKANASARSFNPLRTAIGMLFISVAVACFLIALLSVGFNTAVALSFLLGCFASLVGETLVHGRFLAYLSKRLGVKRAVSYVTLLYLIDLVYLYAVIKALCTFSDKAKIN